MLFFSRATRPACNTSSGKRESCSMHAIDTGTLTNSMSSFVTSVPEAVSSCQCAFEVGTYREQWLQPLSKGYALPHLVQRLWGQLVPTLQYRGALQPESRYTSHQSNILRHKYLH